MKYCTHCGQPIDDNAVVCVHCGCYVQPPQQQPVQNTLDRPSAGYAFLGFFFPIVGLILFLVDRDKYPLRAKSAAKGAIISVVLGVLAFILIMVLMFAGVFMVADSGILEELEVGTEIINNI